MILRQAAAAAAFLAVAAGLSAVFPHRAHAQLASTAPVEWMEVRAKPIGRFRLGSSQTRFGPLEFVGGLELASSGKDFGGFSAMRFLEPGTAFVGVADTGFWFFGRLMRDAEGRPAGVEEFRMSPMVDEAGQVIGDKWYVDAEGLAVHDGIATVSFEREHRVVEYRIDPDGMAGPIRNLDFVIPKEELRRNAGLETVIKSPEGGPQHGARIVIAERSLDPLGNIFGAVIEGPERGVFTVARSDGYDVTDGAFLPNGDLLILERRFTIAQSISMRLRRIPGGTVRAGGLLDGPVLMEANMAYRIDNMEALDVWLREDGATMVSIMSDDNQSVFQRSLYLEFRMVE
ncbi:esterase-like activity of phytase family protein [Aquamicrobium sp. LC103]|uniref:esterase-like activity of phytase family protein n=1 Tax=Aquamicrobium sp. LC103 TaxID=1120658 RepID=UPI00063EC3CC|nr:esterase-like activity of phytase family protein [Aquamicrobium sp. LC103]TKT75292.1 hypothetical protein XW59_019355 [Aquamicrobium sp. LC103]